MELKHYLEEEFERDVHLSAGAESGMLKAAYMAGAKAVAGYIVDAVKDDPTYGDLTTRDERMNKDEPLEREQDNSENESSNRPEVDDSRESAING